MAALKVTNPAITFLPGQNYTTTKAKYRWECQTHGEFTATFNSAKDYKYGCKLCANELKTNNRLTEQQALDRLLEKYPEYEFTFPNGYATNESKVEYKCPIHGVGLGKYSYIVSGNTNPCKLCNLNDVAIKRRKNFSDFKTASSEIHQNKFEYLEESYQGTNSDVVVVCPSHGQFTVNAYSHMTGTGCAKCYHESQKLLVTPPSEYFAKAGGCPKCSGAVSLGESELLEYVRSLGVQADGNVKYNGRKEMDIFLPEYSLAIEYDGLPWHSTQYRTKAEQISKAKELKELGIGLIRVFQDEWELRQEQIKRLIAARIGKLNLTKIYARNCEIVEPTNADAKTFYDLYHVQGWNRQAKHVGLTHDGVLVAVMSFSKATSHRGKVAREGEWELVRYATCAKVVGGAGKLLARFLKDSKAKEIVSYSDNRLFSGKLYSELGFSEVYQVPPSYTYWKDTQPIRLHKSKFRHSELSKILGARYNPELSERRNCEESGYYQIYDDGLTKWKLIKE